MTNYKENFEHLSPVWTHYSDVIVDHGEGTYLYSDGWTKDSWISPAA